MRRGSSNKTSSKNDVHKTNRVGNGVCFFLNSNSSRLYAIEPKFVRTSFSIPLTTSKKHILLGNCFTTNNAAYTNLRGKKPDFVYRHGILGQVMSYLLNSEYKTITPKPYNIGSPNTLITEHIFQPGHLIKAYNIKTLIYIKIISALYGFREKTGKRPAGERNFRTLEEQIPRSATLYRKLFEKFICIKQYKRNL